MLFNKLQTKRKSRAVREFVWPAPAAGLVRAGTLLGGRKDAAEVLENFLPTSEGARLRGGSVKFATVPAAVRRMFTHRSGGTESLFAATSSAIYNVSSVADVDVSPSPSVSGLTNGDWSDTQFSTPGGEFLVIANGSDAVRNYNGTTWTTPTITGVTSSLLSFVWSHASRLWFVEEGTLSAWYLPTNSIAGAAVEFPLGGVFSLGGSLLFGGRWSTDSGDGADDYCVFVTTEGEIAIYQGTDPSSAANWGLVGLYRMGRPLDKMGWFNIGGDIVILTEDGITPVSEVQTKDRAALQSAAITASIEDLWKASVVFRNAQFNFSAVIWPTQTLAIVTVPDGTGGIDILAANTRTGAWSTVSGWSASCLAVFGDDLFFGTSDGAVVQADASGADQGSPYTGKYVPKFQEMGSTDEKIALHGRVLWRAVGDVEPRMRCFSNYEIGEYPVSGEISDSGESVWGSAVWGSAIWGATSTAQSGSNFQAVYGQGFSLAPALVITSEQVAKPVFEIVATTIRYEIGSAI